MRVISKYYGNQRAEYYTQGPSRGQLTYPENSVGREPREPGQSFLLGRPLVTFENQDH